MQEQGNGHTVEYKDEWIRNSRIHHSTSGQVPSSVLLLVRNRIETHMMSLGTDNKGDLGFVCFPTDFSGCSSDAGQFVSGCQFRLARISNSLDDLSVLPFADTISEHEDLFGLLVRVLHKSLEVGLDHFGHSRDDLPENQQISR